MRDPVDTEGAGDDGAVEDPDAGLFAFLAALWRAVGSGVDDGLDPDTGPVQVEGGVVGAVVGGEDDCLPAGQHAVAVQVGASGAGQHHPGPVVVAEHDRAFVRARGYYHRPRPDPPHPLTGDLGRGGEPEVVGTAFQGQHESVVVRAERRGPLQVQRLGVAGELRDRGRDPVAGWPTVDPVGGGEQ
jgi:hypothetical protein